MCRREGCALLLIDIDNFKDTNDLLGHGVGDQVIRQVARTIALRLGPDALLGRLGGDEFAVVVPDRDPTRALELAERLCDAVATTPMVAGLTAQHVTASIGVTTVDRGQDVEAGLAQADLALYAAKKAGRNRTRLFTVEHYDQAVRRVSLLQRVGDALEHGRIELDAQPIVDLTTGLAGRHEVLIRLRDGLDPPVGPAEFLPAAERTDLVLQLDRWVLDRAIGALAASPPESGLRLEVNVSARSLEDDELGRLDPRPPQGGRGRAGPARSRDHRDDRDQQSGRRPPPRGAADRRRMRLRPRRLRCRLRFLLLPQAPAVHHGEDRR